MSQRTLSRVFIILGASLLVVAGSVLLLTLLWRDSPAPVPAAPSASPTASPSVNAETSEKTSTAEDPDPIVAKVNGQPIRYSYWQQTVLLNQVLGEFTGQPSLEQDETLRRLINSELLLQVASPEDEPTAEEVEGYIARLERDLGVDDATVVATLESVGLERAFFEGTIQRLLTVQNSAESLASEGHNISEWLDEQKDSADIQVFEDVSTPAAPTIEPEIARQATSTAPPPATEAPTPTPDIPEVASDFTLERSGGGTVTLSEQLADGPVVLVFFQRGGG